MRRWRPRATRSPAFRERNLFFGGCQAVERSADGVLSGGGDPRRGGAVVVTRTVTGNTQITE